MIWVTKWKCKSAIFLMPLQILKWSAALYEHHTQIHDVIITDFKDTNKEDQVEGTQWVTTGHMKWGWKGMATSEAKTLATKSIGCLERGYVYAYK